MHLSGGMDFPVLLSRVQTHQPQRLNAGSFERCSPECSRQQSGKHRAS